MRKVAYPKNSEYKRLMLYVQDKGIYLFYSTTKDDHGSCADHFFFDIQELYNDCKVSFGINQDDWLEIDDPLPHCQHDLIDPIRIIGRESGNPEYGKLEILKDGEWLPWSQDKKQ